MLNAIEQHGNAKLVGLSLSDLTALLTNADPQGKGTKATNNTEAITRVRAFSFVPDTLSYLALAAVQGLGFKA